MRFVASGTINIVENITSKKAGRKKWHPWREFWNAMTP